MAAGGVVKGREPKEVNNRVSEAEDRSLLAPGRCRKSHDRKKARRKVHWSDHNGNKLVEVLEFQPSDESDSEVEDKDACRCIIM
ncbi:hypothetical protein MLD38_021349 [Melastoma candidum]|uniref:Uncharacterized protein n=1 Tax=Melastoma candidum TaxID=119954 RepID=A0ACB9QGS8_9MYRT|nr:hypothetical protein MLD38_021349 [Melastoma candidum]